MVRDKPVFNNMSSSLANKPRRVKVTPTFLPKVAYEDDPPPDRSVVPRVGNYLYVMSWVDRGITYRIKLWFGEWLMGYQAGNFYMDGVYGGSLYFRDGRIRPLVAGVMPESSVQVLNFEVQQRYPLWYATMKRHLGGTPNEAA